MRVVNLGGKEMGWLNLCPKERYLRASGRLEIGLEKREPNER